MMNYDLNRSHPSSSERYSSSVYSSTSATGERGVGGGTTSGLEGVDGDAEESSATIHESFYSKPSDQSHNIAPSGADHNASDAVSPKDNRAKGKKKLSRESFKNMGKALGGAFNDVQISNKFKKHSSAEGKKNKASDTSENTERATDGNTAGLETIYSHNEEVDDDNYDDHNRIYLYDAQPSISAAAAMTAPHTQIPIQSEEDSPIDPEILKKEKEWDRIPCISLTLVLILISGVVLGIILCSMMSLGAAFQIMGPTILGLSTFVLVYKLYTTVVWKEDPYRWSIKEIRWCIKHLRKCCKRLRR